MDQATQQAAFDLLVQQVHAPVFFQKLASYGIAPQTPDEAVAMLAAGEKLAVLHAQQAQQKSAAAGNWLTSLNGQLDALLGQPQAADAQWAKAAAAQAASRPELARAVLTLLAAEQPAS